MVKSRLDVVRWGPDRMRVGPWRGDARIAYVAPVAGHRTTFAAIDGCLELLARQGYRGVLTAALTEEEQEPFLARGFTVHEHLRLLRHPLRSIPPRPAHRLRRALWFEHDAVLDVDARSFDTFWRFDRLGLADARAATPASRFRVADAGADAHVAGYAVTGRSGLAGYLQRLAVHPDHRGRGVGTALVVDALWWVARRGGTSLLVNTQETNREALALYERLGFEYEERGLSVLERPLGGESTP